jgi:ribosomal protein S15P/S13E
LSSYETTTAGTANGEAEQGKAQEAAQVAQEKAQEAKGKARDRVSTEVDTRSTQAGEQAESVAQDVRSVGEHLRSQGKDKPAEYADKAAERVAEISDYLKRSDGDAILRDAERLGRDKPWAVMAGGIAIGIVASRFLKASSSRRYRELESSSNLPARRVDVDRAAIAPPTGTQAGATSPTPGTSPAPDATRPVPGAPERDLSLSGGVLPPRPAGAGE